jgi:hypothetical protein
MDLHSTQMIPLGYLAKRIPVERPDWLKAPAVVDVYSVSACVNDTLAFYDVLDCSQNGYGMFDSPAVIAATAELNKISLMGSRLFFYEAHESELDGDEWIPVLPDDSFDTKVVPPSTKELVGFDVVTLIDGPNSHSPLSCNGVAAEVHTNPHCLFETISDAMAALKKGAFEGSEEGPYRIYAVYSVTWPE